MWRECGSVIEHRILFEIEFFSHSVHVCRAVDDEFSWGVDLEEVGSRPLVCTIGNGSTGNINDDGAAARGVPGADIGRTGGAIHGLYMRRGGEDTRYGPTNDIAFIVFLLGCHDDGPAEAGEAPCPFIQTVLRNAGKEASQTPRGIARVVIDLDAENVCELFDGVELGVGFRVLLSVEFPEAAFLEEHRNAWPINIPIVRV